MTLIVTCFAYVALIYETFITVLTIIQMVSFAQIMEFEFLNILIQFEGLCKVICCGILAFAVFNSHRVMVRVWLLLSYCQVNWTGAIKVLYGIFNYYFNNQDKAAFLKEVKTDHAPIIGQVLTEIGITLLIYRFYLSLAKPKVIKGPLTAMPVKEKSK